MGFILFLFKLNITIGLITFAISKIYSEMEICDEAKQVFNFTTLNIAPEINEKLKEESNSEEKHTLFENFLAHIVVLAICMIPVLNVCMLIVLAYLFSLEIVSRKNK